MAAAGPKGSGQQGSRGAPTRGPWTGAGRPPGEGPQQLPDGFPELLRVLTLLACGIEDAQQAAASPKHPGKAVVGVLTRLQGLPAL